MKAIERLLPLLSRQRPLLLAMTLGLLAAITNLFTIQLLANASMMLGGIFTMIAALIMAPRHALLASLIGTIGLSLSWHHSWGYLWYPLEVLFVGWMVRQRVHALIADLIYWLFIGIPLVYLVINNADQVSSSMQTVILTKQVLNGYLYTLLASFITMLPGIRTLPGARSLPLPSLQTYLTLAFGMICTLCLLSYGLLSERSYTHDHQQRVEAKLKFSSQHLTDDLETKLTQIQQQFANYAHLLSLTPPGSSETRMLTGLLKTTPELSSVVLLDAEGKEYRSIQTELFQRPLNTPLPTTYIDQHSAQEAGQNHVISFSPVLKRSRLNTYPMLAVSAPIYHSNQHDIRYTLQGLIDLKGFELTLQNFFKTEQLDYVIADDQNRVIFSSRNLSLPLLHPFLAQPKHSKYSPIAIETLTLELEQGEKEYFFNTIPTSNGWQVMALVDTSLELEILQQRYLRWVLFIVLASLSAIYLGKWLANLFTRPLLSLLKFNRHLKQEVIQGQFHYSEHQQLYNSLERKSNAIKTYYDSLEQQVHARTHELQVLNERMNRVLQSSSDGIVEIDAMGRINFANKTLAGWLAQEANQLQGLSVDQLLFPVDGAQTLEQCVHKARFTQSLSQGEGLLKIGQKVLELEFNVAPTLYENGQVGAVVMMRNIGSRKELQRTLEQVRHRTEQASRAKSDFVANMSHEIRTPLNAIAGLVQLFDRKNLSQQQHQFLQRMEHGTELLQGVVNDILDFSKIESGHLELESQAFDIEAVMAHLNLLLAARAQQHQLRLSCLVKDGVPRGLIGDPLRLTQIMMNLLSNAIKFTPQGSVVATVSCQPDSDDDKVKIRFEVSDTGIGISNDKLESLFSPFTQANSAISRQYGGTGLGLAISQRLVSLMGGQLEVSSILNHGSKFWFDIQMPVASAEQNLLQPPSSQQAPPDVMFFPQQVLVVEDNEVNLQITRLMLERIGLIPVLANNGEQALRILKQHPDLKLILMDLQMPEQDGLEVTAIIRQQPEYDAIPVIALTAHASLLDKQRCMEGGMQEHLSKPINMHDLIRVLSRFLRYQTVSSQGANQRFPAPTAKDAGEQLIYFLRHFGQLAQELQSLIDFEAWADANALLSKALKATSALPFHAIRGLIFTLQAELSQGHCSEGQLQALQVQIEKLQSLNQQPNPVS